MDPYFLKISLAGFLYIITPGPVFLSILTIASEENRLAAFRLVSGAFLGCMLWLNFTVFSFIEANRLPNYIFTILIFACGSYLLWLSYRMFKRARIKQQIKVFKKPFLEGLIIGCLNPKSYPVMLSVFTALMLDQVHQITWETAPVFFLFAISGIVIGNLFMVTISGFKVFTTFYKQNIALFSYLFSFIYLSFGLNLLLSKLL